MNRTDDISNLFNRFGASADSYLEFSSQFDYKEKPLTLVPTASEPVPAPVSAPVSVIEAEPQVNAVNELPLVACTDVVEKGSELKLFKPVQPAAPLRQLLAEVALARQAEAQARNEVALSQVLHHDRPTKTRAHVIALVSAKGGVGKSTLASALTTVMRLDGGQTIAIDLDPQNALQHHLGAEPDVAGMGNASLMGENWKSLLLDGSAGSLLLPYGALSEDERRTLERYLDNDRYWLARQLASMELGENDVVIIDTPPGRTLYLDQALMVADQVLVVATADAACFVTLDQMERVLGERMAQGQAPLCSYVINQFDSSREFCRDMQEVIKRRLGSHLLGAVALDHGVGEALAYGHNPMLDMLATQACRDMLALSHTLKAQMKSMVVAESYAS
ncbi:cellulose biosynthesis protein BcsQ [Pseudomonas vancouverensis]|uniref:Cellulose synthase operon protein YhjQ n=1 Tax=Pseudomonas vancouverensis TaxID=95300 RepID=A0A1H2PCS3_PSEVA|nr:cellulose biosynthesis protein BcsQ [Pseudomonas vancouverensis]KAB0493610.1 cellulose synthase operon protein YhjQ [Pseudomonas vancouverensis]TDB67813.1 cellulose synthase operon protein YhjQ [Pseudomonas vancouverensis]SDV15529.1 cellulose synthase operon protein YhjQ [Pseudomonas vancouverensis]